MRTVIFSLALCLGILRAPAALADPVPPCADCAKQGWPVPLAPGPVRLALPSPDGSRLAVLGGPGVEERDHTVLVVERDCAGGLTQMAVLANDARYPVEPKELPARYVRLQWSPDGNWLYAAGGVYQMGKDKEGNLTAKRTRALPLPFLDFRFGPGDRGVAIEVPEARVRRARADGEELFTVTLNYVFVNRVRDLTQTINPPDLQMGYWVPKIWEGPPAVSWDAEGAAVLSYPFQKTFERFLPGKVREPVDAPPAFRSVLEGTKFETAGECSTRWELVSDNKADRIKLKVE